MDRIFRLVHSYIKNTTELLRPQKQNIPSLTFLSYLFVDSLIFMKILIPLLGLLFS